MRGKGTTTRLKQPERAQAPPHGEQSSAFRETNHSIDASSWIFTSQHDSLVKGLHKSAPPDLQVWARRRRQAARKAQIPTKKPVTRTRSRLSVCASTVHRSVCSGDDGDPAGGCAPLGVNTALPARAPESSVTAYEP